MALKKSIILTSSLLIFNLNSFCQKMDLQCLFENKQFLTMELANKNPNKSNYYFFKAVFANVCNNPTLSNNYLDTLTFKKIPSNLLLNYWKLRTDNYVKLFNYKKAFETNHYINKHFKSTLSAEHYKGSTNAEHIWKSLQDEAPQKTFLEKDVAVPLTKDFGGLFNIKVSINQIDTSFVFDTGAGISVIANSLAKKLSLRILESDSINVSGFTGIANETRMAIADSIAIGDLKIYNAYFLIFNDEALTFADGNYKINGIIGFPILKEIGSIMLLKDTIQFANTYRKIPVKEKNLFTEYLHPILYLTFNGDLLPFCFDTGGNETLFSRTFFERYKSSLEKDPHKTASQKIASVGGEIKYQSITMENLSLNLNTFKLTLKNLEINKDQYHRFGKEFYGNFGKDGLSQFSKVVISFKGNYLELTK